ncbi:MAG: ribosome maturation factor RimP [Acidimicrobiia bacterium]|nr:ribosome maturation factor RimP [Acidimicrobiia bacterium]
MSDVLTSLEELIGNYLGAERLELDDLEMLGQGSGRILRVVIDGADVGVDHLAELSRGISRLLDHESDLDGSYTLEVTSPGLERRLRRPAHYSKSIGKEVTVKTRVEIDGERRHEGTLIASDEDGLLVDVEGEARRIEFDQVKSARTVFRWERAPKPGKKAARS